MRANARATITWTPRLMQRRLEGELGDLMKPLKVTRLSITKADGTSVRGILMTACPLEKSEAAKDFEVRFSEDRRGLTYAVVDGRILLPRRRRGSSRAH